jgi:hypothetical protein
VLLLLTHDDPRFEDLIPGKFYEYAGSGKPMLAITKKEEIVELIEKNQLGYFADPKNPAEIADILWHIFRLWQRKQLQAVPTPPAEFQRPYQAGQLAEILNEVTTQKGKENK